MTDRVLQGIVIAALFVGVATVLAALSTWPNPLTVAVVTAIIGGLVTSPFFVFVGYFLSERKNRERAQAEVQHRQAKAALFFGFITEAMRKRAEALPVRPSDVTNPSAQLTYSTAELVPLVAPDSFIDAYGDLPSGLREDAAATIITSNDLVKLVRAARRRTDEITRVQTGEAPSVFDENRLWDAEDTKDTEFVKLYEPVLAKRRELISALDGVQPRLVALTKALELKT